MKYFTLALMLSLAAFSITACSDSDTEDSENAAATASDTSGESPDPAPDKGTTDTDTEAVTDTESPDDAIDASFAISIVSGQPEGGPSSWRVEQGEKVEFLITADDAYEVHLHAPYDVAMEITPGPAQSMIVEADITGSVEFEVHDTAALLGNLEVR